MTYRIGHPRFFFIMITPDKLNEQIAKSFKKLLFAPRGNQSEIIFDVLDSFLNKNKQNVILGAPTGIGKSVIGAVVSDALASLTPGDELASVISMSTNILAEQYKDSFSKLGTHDVFQIKGASNYSCRYMENQLTATVKTAEACVEKDLHPLEVEKNCRKCEYSIAKKTINSTQILITNYSYFLINALASNHLKERKVHVFDEAHLLNDIFCNYTEILVSVEIIDKYIKELNDTNGKCEVDIESLLSLQDAVRRGAVGEHNYRDVLKMMQEVYINIYKILSNMSELLKSEDLVKSSKYGKLARRYDGFASKIKDLFENEYEHVFDNSVANTFSIKTIFVGKMMEHLLAPYNLFMSATITENFVFETLELNEDTTVFIEVDPVFPKENKPLLFLGKQALNYYTMKEQSTIDDIKTQIKMIVQHHETEKGLILVPSFFLGSQLTRAVGPNTKVFEHKSGIKLPDLVSEFKRYKGSAVLISPSIFEGLDFKDDASRFQIIVKSPFPSLGDKRIKHIADNYPNIYSEMTLLKILQGIGRSVRTPEDWAATYFLDASSKKLYDSKLNIWKSHYDVKT